MRISHSSRAWVCHSVVPESVLPGAVPTQKGPAVSRVTRSEGLVLGTRSRAVTLPLSYSLASNSPARLGMVSSFQTRKPNLKMARVEVFASANADIWTHAERLQSLRPVQEQQGITDSRNSKHTSPHTTKTTPRQGNGQWGRLWGRAQSEVLE